MNKDLVSAHVFLYYESIGKYVLDTLSKFYNGPLYLSLIENNCSNDILLTYAKNTFSDIRLVYIDNHGTDQYGFYSTFPYDNTNKPWIFYCHDKHPNKQKWLSDLLNIYVDLDDKLLLDSKAGMIACAQHKQQQASFEELLKVHESLKYKFRKEVVQSMHTLIWLHELERILLSKYNLGDKNFKCPEFSAGNIFLARREVIAYSHGCVYEEFFNKGVYRTDGEVGHGLERFYYYVSKCLQYNNIFI